MVKLKKVHLPDDILYVGKVPISRVQGLKDAKCYVVAKQEQWTQIRKWIRNTRHCKHEQRSQNSDVFFWASKNIKCVVKCMPLTHTDSHKSRHALTIPHEAVRATDEIGRQQRRPRSASASLGSVPSIHDQSVQMLNQSVPEGSVGPPAIGARARE